MTMYEHAGDWDMAWDPDIHFVRSDDFFKTIGNKAGTRLSPFVSLSLRRTQTKRPCLTSALHPCMCCPLSARGREAAAVP